MRKIVITGSHSYPDLVDVERRIDALYIQEMGNSEGLPVLVTDGGFKVDNKVRAVARGYGFEVQSLVADWRNDGPEAGTIRDKELVNQADLLILFTDGEWETQLIELAIAAKKSLEIHFPSNK